MAQQDARRRQARRIRPGVRRRAGAGTYRAAAQARLRRFRQGSALAVSITGLLLLLVNAPALPEQTALAQDSVSVLAQDTVPASPEQAVEEATGTLRDLARGMTTLLPKLLIALGLLGLAGVLASVVKPLLRRALGNWSRAAALSAAAGVLIWLLAISSSLAVVTGDVRTLLGAVGLLGLALSWALQAPIESFSAWVLNSFREYYRIGDRIAVGDVFGDVQRIDFLTTTVWETGGADGVVRTGQPTGGLITFPNSEVLRSNIVNYTRDFPWIWDEVSVGIANESDLRYAMECAAEVAARTVGDRMKEPAMAYQQLLRRTGIMTNVSEQPEVYLSASDSWTNITVRYLVPARARRTMATRMLLELSEEMARPEHARRIIPAYPVRRISIEHEPDTGPAI